MINKVILVGNVGSEPTYRVMDGGLKNASFRIATTDRYKDANGEIKEQTEWHNIECWRNLADIVDKWVHKGDKVYIEGSLKYRNYVKDGVDKTLTQIVVKELKLLSPKKESQPDVKGNLTTQPQVVHTPQPTPQPQPMPPVPPMASIIDDIPF